MKRIILSLTLVILCLTFAGCKEEEAAPPAPTQTQMHTIPPTEEINSELEWAPVDCDIVLNNSESQPVLYGDDFDTFALVGTNDDDSYIVIKLSEDATNAVKAMEKSDDMPLLIDNVEVAKISLDPTNFNGEITFGIDDTILKLQEYANTMRAL